MISGTRTGTETVTGLEIVPLVCEEKSLEREVLGVSEKVLEANASLVGVTEERTGIIVRIDGLSEGESE